MKPNLLTKGVKYYNLLKLNYKKWTDPNFNSFLQFNGENGLETINSKEKLAFMKLIDLSKQGFINPERKKFYQKEKELYRLMDIDQGIKNIGRISIVDNDGVRSQVYIGFNEESKKLFLSDRQVNQIPIWTKPSLNGIKNVFSSVMPKTGQLETDNGLFDFKKEFFNYDVEGLPAVLRTNLEKEFNKLAEIAFKSNKYLIDKVPALPDDFSQSNKSYLSMNFKVPSSFFPQLEQSNGFTVVSFQGKDDRGYIFKPVISGNNDFLKVSSENLEDRLNERNVELIGKFNHKIAIGIDRKNGSPQIGIKTSNSGYIWKPYSRILKSSKLNEHEKSTIKHVVENRDFLLEKNKVVLKNPLDSKEELVVKQHCSKEGLYFLETYADKMPYSLSNFKKLNTEKAKAFLEKYKSTGGINNFRKLIAEKGLLQLTENKSNARTTKSVLHR